MDKYIRKTEVVEAEQWYKVDGTGEEGYHLGVGYYRRPDVDDTKVCEHCGQTMHDHGWIDSGGEGYNVCPGDWIIKDGDEFIPVPTAIFEDTYTKLTNEQILVVMEKLSPKSGDVIIVKYDDFGVIDTQRSSLIRDLMELRNHINVPVVLIPKNVDMSIQSIDETIKIMQLNKKLIEEQDG